MQLQHLGANRLREHGDLYATNPPAPESPGQQELKGFAYLFLSRGSWDFMGRQLGEGNFVVMCFMLQAHTIPKLNSPSDCTHLLQARMTGDIKLVACASR